MRLVAVAASEVQGAAHMIASGTIFFSSLVGGSFARKRPRTPPASRQV